MENQPTAASAATGNRKPLRLWPGVMLAAALLLVRFVVPLFVPGTGGLAILATLVGGLLILVWWLFFSRAPWLERVAAVAWMVVAIVIATQFVHESIANGAQGMLLTILAIPFLCLALVGSAMIGRRMTSLGRLMWIAAASAVVGASFTLIRTGGITGDADSDIHWRWSPTPEDRLLAQTDVELVAIGATAAAAESGANWPGFRGPNRDSVVRGVQVETNWVSHPPIELWRRPIGPGWSSFAVQGDRLFTQEQRGEDEVVACYQIETGKPIWMHRDATRFWESNAGAGPRATPTLHDGRLYSLGATGILNVLDAQSGAVVWSKNAAMDTGVPVPGWGFSGSPIVVDDRVIVATSGALIAYDAESGEKRWSRPSAGGSYSSPHLLTLAGVPQVLFLGGAGMISVLSGDGTVLWENAWEGSAILQPALVGDDEVLISTGDAMGGMGIRRLAVSTGSNGWVVEERWTSKGLKPYFNDFVVHGGYAYGFDGSILACIDLADGQRKWKGGRYGNGQLLLLADQDLLLVLSERGDLALVDATPNQFHEQGRIAAIEGKTWNHPVLVGDLLLVRNSEEMAAFRIPKKPGS